MRILINCLSIGSLSGEHVAFGFSAALLERLAEDDRIFVLYYRGQPIPPDLHGSNVRLLPVSDRLRHWALRSSWEPFAIRRVVRHHSIDRVLGFNGALTPLVPVPQVVLAQNPWAFIRQARNGIADEVKAFLQRRAYRRAYFGAAHLLFVSDYLREQYRAHFQASGKRPAPSTIAFEGLDAELFAAAEEKASNPRKPFSVLSVSVYAPWKGVETVVAAIDRLRAGGTPATLSLVGPWGDDSYEQQIRAQVKHLSLDEAVTFHGEVSKADLYRHYASHQVFCLMSRCESFGIPAAEAMAFGTPVVSSADSAIAEVCAGAGFFGRVDAASWVASALKEILTDASVHRNLSSTARERAAALTWAQASVPLLRVLGVPAPG